jgi:hypothetical protein
MFCSQRSSPKLKEVHVWFNEVVGHEALLAPIVLLAFGFILLNFAPREGMSGKDFKKIITWSFAILFTFVFVLNVNGTGAAVRNGRVTSIGKTFAGLPARSFEVSRDSVFIGDFSGLCGDTALAALSFRFHLAGLKSNPPIAVAEAQAYYDRIERSRRRVNISSSIM